jgi:hypothetical protein
MAGAQWTVGSSMKGGKISRIKKNLVHMDIDRVFAEFGRIHGGHPAWDSAVYGLVGDAWPSSDRVAAALLADADRHRCHLDLALMVVLTPPTPGCLLCRGTGAEAVAGGQSSLCRCVGGEFARTWVV